MFLEGRILTRKKALFFRGSKEKDSFNFIYAAFIPDASTGVFRRKYITKSYNSGKEDSAERASLIRIIHFLTSLVFFSKREAGDISGLLDRLIFFFF